MLTANLYRAAAAVKLPSSTTACWVRCVPSAVRANGRRRVEKADTGVPRVSQQTWMGEILRLEEHRKQLLRLTRGQEARLAWKGRGKGR